MKADAVGGWTWVRRQSSRRGGTIVSDGQADSDFVVRKDVKSMDAEAD